MYYVWGQNPRLSGKYAHFSEEPEGFELTDWISGKAFKKPPSILTLKSDEGKSTNPTDLLLTRFNVQIFSPKLIQVLAEIGVKNLDYYPVRLVNHETGEVTEDHRVVNIIGAIHCLDIENSKCERFDDGDLMSVEEFAIDEQKIEDKKKSREYLKIFRLGEFPFIILVDESVKARLEKAAVTGIKFVKPSEYVGI